MPPIPEIEDRLVWRSLSHGTGNGFDARLFSSFRNFTHYLLALRFGLLESFITATDVQRSRRLVDDEKDVKGRVVVDRNAERFVRCVGRRFASVGRQ